MSGVYGVDYAEVYDVMYADKPYEREVDFIEVIFKKFGKSPKTVLDVGCGTGRHGQILTERGYEVTGVDRAEAMIETAKSRVKFKVEVADLSRWRDCFKTGCHNFDAVISLFGVLGYITDDLELQKTLNNIRFLTKHEGLFLFEVWNGPAVLNVKPEIKVKENTAGNIHVIRRARPTLDPMKNLCNVEYWFKVEKDGKLDKTFKENHLIRYFFPLELKRFLEEAGFKLLAILPFLETEREATWDDWRIMVVAEAV